MQPPRATGGFEVLKELRYEALQNDDGWWQVTDRYTRLPAASDGREFTKLSHRDAIDIAEALNTYLLEGKTPPLV